MLIQLHPLPRAHDITTTKIDLRQIMILGPSSNQEPYLPSSVPVIADLRPTTNCWSGAMVLGGSTERLMLHYGHELTVHKLCAYRLESEHSHVNEPPGPEIVEYLCIGDPSGALVFYKCRRRRWGMQASFVFPEQIDRFAVGLTEQAWFQTPVCAALCGQMGLIDPAHSTALEEVFSYLDEVLVGSNLITTDCYEASEITQELAGVLSEVDYVSKTGTMALPEDINLEWLELIGRNYPVWDSFLQRAILGYPMHHAELLRQLGPNPFDLTPPAALQSKIQGVCFAVPLTYMGVVALLDRVRLTDFAVRVDYSTGANNQLIFEYIIDRFASAWSGDDLYANQLMLHNVFALLQQTYATLAPNIAPTLVALRIERSFNEEALIEFTHYNPRHDHAMHVDFALLSYCSVGLGRFFHTAATLPR